MLNAAKKFLLTDEKGTVKYRHYRKKRKKKLLYCIYLKNTPNYKLPVMNDTCSKHGNFFFLTGLFTNKSKLI